jgi:hypothetical protein
MAGYCSAVDLAQGRTRGPTCWVGTVQRRATSATPPSSAVCPPRPSSPRKRAPTQVTTFACRAPFSRQKDSHTTRLLSCKSRSWRGEHSLRSRKCGQNLRLPSPLSTRRGTTTSRVCFALTLALALALASAFVVAFAFVFSLSFALRGRWPYVKRHCVV